MLDLPAVSTGLATALELDGATLAVVMGVVFLAGVVRGFSGFALSALIVAGLATVISPVALIPVCIVLEGTASLVMFRRGTRAEADWRIVRGLALGSVLGLPLGLQATLLLHPDASRFAALILITALAALQLIGRAPPALASRPGLYLSGLLAGVATGIAGVGGMVVALYVLAANAPPARMRASLVMFLFIGVFTSGAWLIATGVLDRLALVRGLALSPVVVIGVLAGTRLFRPSLQRFYRGFCLALLIGLSLAGLIRLAVTS